MPDFLRAWLGTGISSVLPLLCGCKCSALPSWAMGKQLPSGPSYPLWPHMRRKGGQGAGVTGIGILLEAHLNNLMAISRATVGGRGSEGRFIERIHSRLGFCLPLFSWHLSCMF